MSNRELYDEIKKLNNKVEAQQKVITKQAEDIIKIKGFLSAHIENITRER